MIDEKKEQENSEIFAQKIKEIREERNSIDTELMTAILANVLSKKITCINFPYLSLDAKEIVESTCYKTLLKIKNIVADDSLSDEECFGQIEAIVSTLEDIGSGGGGRHDF